MRQLSKSSYELTKEMALMAKDFHRLLPKALNDSETIRAVTLPCHIDVDLGKDAIGCITFTLTPQPDRQLSPIWSMPVALLALRFEDIPVAYIEDFVARFDLSFRRGGG
jgi:hypothetical protein